MNNKALVILAFACLIAACRSGANLPPTPAVSSSAVLEACDPELQAQAMRADQRPTWEDLELVACYELNLDLGEGSGAYTGSARVTFTNLTGSPLPDLVFRAYPRAPRIFGGSLDVTDVQVDRQPTEPLVFLPDRTGLRINLPQPLEPGETAVVEMTLAGRTPVNLQGVPNAYGAFNLTTDLAVLALANWHPILADLDGGQWRAEPVVGPGDPVVSETALFRVAVVAPDGWSLVTTGTEVGTINARDRPATLFVSGPVREFMVLASPSFTLLEQQQAGVTIKHWGLPEGRAFWQEALQATVDSLDVFDERFGPYPYAELDVVAAPLDNAAGIEYPGLFLLLDSLYRPNTERPFLLGLVAAHETAHQWWYGVVGSDALRHPWQDEGLTTFSSTLYQAEHQPAFYLGTLENYRQTLDQLGPASPENAVGQPADAFINRPRLYGPVVYTKGALFFQALREQLGERAFFQALGEYYESFRYRQALPEDLLSSFERSCSCDLDDFYREWGVR